MWLQSARVAGLALRLTPSLLAGLLVDQPQSGESEPLGHEREAVRQERRRPREQDGHDAEGESAVAVLSALLAELHTPVDRTEEGEDDRAVGDLYVLDNMQLVQRALQVKASDGVQAWRELDLLCGRRHTLRSPGRLSGEEDCPKRSAEVWERSRQAKEEGWLGDDRKRLRREGFLLVRWDTVTAALSLTKSAETLPACPWPDISFARAMFSAALADFPEIISARSLPTLLIWG